MRNLDSFKSVIFDRARKARNAKRKSLQNIPQTRKKSATALINGLQKKFYHIALVELAWRGEACSSLIDFFRDEINNYGWSTGPLKYNPLFTKTAQGDQRTADCKWLCPNVENENLAL